MTCEWIHKTIIFVLDASKAAPRRRHYLYFLELPRILQNKLLTISRNLVRSVSQYFGNIFNFPFCRRVIFMMSVNIAKMLVSPFQIFYQILDQRMLILINLAIYLKEPWNYWFKLFRNVMVLVLPLQKKPTNSFYVAQWFFL